MRLSLYIYKVLLSHGDITRGGGEGTGAAESQPKINKMVKDKRE